MPPFLTIRMMAYKSTYFSGSILGSPKFAISVSTSRINIGSYTSSSDSLTFCDASGVIHANKALYDTRFGTTLRSVTRDRKCADSRVSFNFIIISPQSY